MTPHDFLELSPGVYRVEVPDQGIVLHVDRLRREHGDLLAELTVSCSDPQAHRLTDEDVISAGTVNLSSIRARQDRASYLAKRSNLSADRFDWGSAVEYLAIRVINAERVGQPALLLRDVPKPEAELAWTVYGVPILKRQPMILFGDGGAGKSTLALAILGTLARQGERPLYLDWEADEGEHREKLEQLFGPAMPDVCYLRGSAPLIHDVDRVRRAVLAHGITYLAIDSAGVATSGPPEAAESANEFFRALRQIGLGALILAHIPHREGGEYKPFGSVFWHNLARSTWYLKRSEADGAPGMMTVALHHRKANRGPLLPARGLDITFGDRITITSANLAEHPDFAAKLPTWQRMLAQIRAAGPCTAAELAREIDCKVDTIQTAARRHPQLFGTMAGADGITRIALLERRPA